MATDKSSADFWQKGLAQMWAESGEDMVLIRKAIDMAWKDYGSSSPSGYVNTCRKLRALKVKPPQMPGAFV